MSGASAQERFRASTLQYPDDNKTASPNKSPNFILQNVKTTFTMLLCIKVSLICHIQNQVIRNIALKASIGDLIISFHSYGRALASDSFKVGCKSVPFFQFLVAYFFDFLLGG